MCNKDVNNIWKHKNIKVTQWINTLEPFGRVGYSTQRVVLYSRPHRPSCDWTYQTDWTWTGTRADIHMYIQIISVLDCIHTFSFQSQYCYGKVNVFKCWTVLGKTNMSKVPDSRLVLITLILQKRNFSWKFTKVTCIFVPTFTDRSDCFPPAALHSAGGCNTQRVFPVGAPPLMPLYL